MTHLLVESINQVEKSTRIKQVPLMPLNLKTLFFLSASHCTFT